MITRLTESDPSKLDPGQAMELVLDPLTVDDGAAACSPTHSHRSAEPVTWVGASPESGCTRSEGSTALPPPTSASSR